MPGRVGPSGGWDHRAGDAGQRLAHDHGVIRNVAIHITNEQPLMADLFDLPSASDAGLLCTNLRSMDGKRPVFTDHIESTFFFPYRVVRFLEIVPGAIERHVAEGGTIAFTLPAPSADGLTEDPGQRLPAVIIAGDGAGEDDGDAELEIDEDFLRRIREA